MGKFNTRDLCVLRPAWSISDPDFSHVSYMLHFILYFINNETLSHLVTPPRDSDMQRVVAANFGISCLTPTVVGLQERLAFLGDDKVQDHCCPSCESSLMKHTVTHRFQLKINL